MARYTGVDRGPGDAPDADGCACWGRPRESLGADGGGGGGPGTAEPCVWTETLTGAATGAGAGAASFCGTVTSRWQEGHWSWWPPQSSSQEIFCLQ